MQTVSIEFETTCFGSSPGSSKRPTQGVWALSKPAPGRQMNTQELMLSTIPWMKNLRRATNSSIVGIDVKITAVMIHGMLPPP